MRCETLVKFGISNTSQVWYQYFVWWKCVYAILLLTAFIVGILCFQTKF